MANNIDEEACILNSLDDGQILLQETEALLGGVKVLGEDVLRHAQGILQFQPPITTRSLASRYGGDKLLSDNENHRTCTS